ncbi:MAG: zinc-dependent peptidase [Phycisphaerae bacterium]|nr:zinc-dependent peptidase [Phycisphaerae bacterium]
MSWFDRIFRRKRLRRNRIISQPFPDDWRRVVRRSASFYPHLPREHRRVLRECIQVFIAEKEFLGIDDLTITDEIKVTIAAPACLLIVGTPHLGVYPSLREVIVQPHDFGDVVEAVGPDGRRYRIAHMRSGEAWRRGPVVLAWNSVEHAIAHPCDGYNVVFHEFAHVLDMQAGIADGVPPLPTKHQQAAWSRVFDAEYKAFIEAARRGRRTFLDPYGASSPAEFFAVVTEHFFEQPLALARKHAELYAQLRIFYQQDPAKWSLAAKSGKTARWM